MGMNTTPKGERVHIALFGKRNAGKSSIINKITGQDLSIVSDVKGTTTDPVYKAMELLPIGPIMLVDTPGLDDEGKLGEMRMEKTRNVLQKTDIAIIAVDASDMEKLEMEHALAKELKERKIPCLWVFNKAEMLSQRADLEQGMYCSTKTGEGIEEIKKWLASQAPKETNRPLVRDLVEQGDLVVLVIPIDSAAPKGRLILPQQQVIRDLLEKGAIPVVTREVELESVFHKLRQKPRLVITDSQAFEQVAKVTPQEIPLTSFSILMARYKGNLAMLAKNASKLETLKDGDRILMAEGCTHHRQCDDIGTVKIPRWIRQYTGKELIFETSSGGGYPKDLTRYAMIVHCGACMLPQKEMQFRMKSAKEQGVVIVNYGILIAYMKRIVQRSLQLFPEIIKELDL